MVVVRFSAWMETELQASGRAESEWLSRSDAMVILRVVQYIAMEKE